jgi:Uncharacterised nucleotidyltransferase
MRARALVDDETRLILRAALFPGDRALAAFTEWRARYDPIAISYSLRRLLPLVHANLVAAGCRDPLLPQFKGVRRSHWLKNQILLRGGRSALATLEAAGIPAMVLKGAGMIACWYQDNSLRPLGDVDVLVPTAQARAAVECLVRAGWRPVGIVALTATLLSRLPSWGFEQGGCALDLHWHMLHQATQPDADAAFWDASGRSSFGYRRVRVPCPEDQLFHACAHGMQAQGADRLFWPADASWIIRGAGASLDWNRVVGHAVRLRLVTQLAACLAFLADELELPIPREALRGLRAARPSMLERLEFALRRSGPTHPGKARAALLAFQDFRRRTGGLVRRSAALAVGPYFRDRWALDAGAYRTIGYALAAAFGRPDWLRPLWLSQPRLNLLASLARGAGDLAFSALDDHNFFHGWSWPEANGRWTDGPEAIVALRPVRPVGNSIVLRALVDPFVTTGHSAMRVSVWANDTRVAVWWFWCGVSKPERRSVVPAAALRQGEPLLLTFVIRRPCRPCDIGHSADTRDLGIFVRSLAVSPLETDVS